MTRNQSITSPRKYWLDALRPEVEAIWGSHRVWKESEYISRIAYYAAMMTFWNSDEGDIENRRLLLYEYLKGIFNTESSEDILNLFKHRLPITTLVPKVLGNLCTVYNSPPQRKWVLGGLDVSNQIKPLFLQANADLQIAEAYNMAVLCGGCLVRPYINDDGQLRLMVLTPDLFHCVADDNGEKLRQVTIPTRKVNARTGKQEIVFTVWTAQEYWEEDYRGNRIPFLFDGQLVDSVANGYGAVPFVVLREREPLTGKLFSGGLFDIVEMNLTCNQHELQGDYLSIYESFKTWVGINLNLTENRLRIGPGSVLDLNNVTAGSGIPLAEPALTTVGPDGDYDSIEELNQKRKQRKLRERGIPAYIADESVGQPPSGVSLAIQREELTRVAAKHRMMLRRFEQELTVMVIRVWNTDVAQGSAGMISHDVALNIDYAEETIPLEPQQQLEHDLLKVLVGVKQPSQFLREQSGVDSIETNDGEDIEQAAVRILSENVTTVTPLATHFATIIGKTFAGVAVATDNAEVAAMPANDNELRGSVGGSAQIASLQKDYYAKAIPRDAAINNVITIFGLSLAEAEGLFIAEPPDAPTNAASIVADDTPTTEKFSLPS